MKEVNLVTIVQPSGVVKPSGGTQLQSKDIIGSKGPILPVILFSKIVLFGHAWWSPATLFLQPSHKGMRTFCFISFM